MVTDPRTILSAVGVSLPEVEAYEAARREVRLASSGGSFLAYPPDVDGPLHEQVRTADAAVVALAKELAKWKWVAEHEQEREYGMITSRGRGWCELDRDESEVAYLLARYEEAQHE